MSTSSRLEKRFHRGERFEATGAKRDRMAISTSLGEAHVLRVAGGALAYRDSGGTGRPVLFVHGVLVNADLWRNVVPALTPQYRCIAPDWPLGGHEYAMAPHADLTPPGLAAMIGETMLRLDLRDVIVVANDTGAALVQIVLAHHAERLGAAVLLSGDSFEHFFPAPLNALPPVARIPGAIDLIAPLLRSRAGAALLTASIAHTAPPEAILRSYLGHSANREVRRDTAKFLGSVDNAYTIEAAAHFGSFALPVAVGWAEDDVFFPPHHGARLTGAFPNATLRMIPKSRTLVPEDAPFAVAELVREVASKRA